MAVLASLLPSRHAGTKYVPWDPSNEFEQWVGSHTTGPIIHKRRGYFAVYERHFRAVRASATPSRPVRMLEIGVQSGGSLEMWKSYFGERSLELHGIDINPGTARFNRPERNITIHVGSTSDPKFMSKTVARLPALDIVVDDGSHHSLDIRRAFVALFPKVTTQGGVYLVEDLHTNYMRNSEFQERGENWTFIAMAKALVDELHDAVNRDGVHARLQRRDERDLQLADFANSIASIHFHSGVVVFEKIERQGVNEDALAGDLKVPHSRLEHSRPLGTPSQHRTVGFEDAARLIAGLKAKQRLRKERQRGRDE